MTPPDYTPFDDCLMTAIAGGRTTVQALISLLHFEATAIAPVSPAFRTIDRRLQSLKKRKLVVFDKEARAWGLTLEGAQRAF